MKYSIVGLFLGLVAAVCVYLIERTTGDVFWLLVVSFPISWAIAGYLAQKWELL